MEVLHVDIRSEQLRHLTLINRPIGLDVIMAQTHLTHLDITDYPLAFDWTYVLRPLTTLATLEAASFEVQICMHLRRTTPRNTGRVQLNNLKELSLLSVFGASVSLCILNEISAPNLQDL